MLCLFPASGYVKSSVLNVWKHNKNVVKPAEADDVRKTIIT